MDNKQINKNLIYDVGKAIECALGIIFMLPGILFLIVNGLWYYDETENLNRSIFWGLMFLGGSLLFKNNIHHLISLCKDLHRKWKEHKLKKSSLNK